MESTDLLNPGKGSSSGSKDLETAVLERYAKGAQAREAALCSPVAYAPHLLEALPREILERDYGCGDPSRFVKPGETVLDLGSGSGKICYIMSQIVGPSGSVIGIDFNDEMLALARKYAPEMKRKLGFGNVEFRKGKIQDLALDPVLLDRYLARNPVRTTRDLDRLRAETARIKASSPLVADSSIDLVVSNCVLNLVSPEDKANLFREIYRVLKKDGRIAISDIVADENVPPELEQDPELWSSCVSGAFREDNLFRTIETAGFHGISIESWNPEPYRVVNGIEFRSVTVTAHKGKEGACLERKQAVIYRGPWKSVTDDDQHTLRRGIREAVCDKTYRLYQTGPYRKDLVFIDPRVEVHPEEAAAFECGRTRPRHPRESKGETYRATQTQRVACCDPSDKKN